LVCLAAGVLYGSGRLYFKVTGGFKIEHISSDFAYDPRWETRALSPTEQENVDRILSQKFTYLGKGCQSYVFRSEDDQYVLKFFKYQRFRPQFYFYWLSFLPAGEELLKEKIEKKTQKRENLFASWRIAFDHLKDETGLVFVHLNKTNNLNKQVKIYDKLGVEYILDIDNMEFSIQKKAKMLCETLEEMVAEGKTPEAKQLLSKLMAMVVTEYQKGYADNDHALMQNTGVYNGIPIHIDVGQFEINPTFSNPAHYHQEIFNKTWKFRNWLRKHYPELLAHLDQELIQEMGDKFYSSHFIPREK
jgi:hypothetical protein